MIAAIRLIVVATILALAAALSPARAQTLIRVPGDHTTIQAAIDAANARDVIQVGPGVYRENIDFKGKAVEVHSTHGPDQTAIDGGYRGSTVTFKSGEDADTLLSGFTVTGGSGTGVGLFRVGGGIYCLNSSPVIGNNVIRGNVVNGLFGLGGGLYVEGGQVTVVACRFDGNVVSGSGGGLYAVDATMIITRCRFIENNADLGGGAFFSRGAVTLWNSAFLRNTARGGGGLYSQLNQGLAKLVIHNTFSGNKATAFGGGIASASESLRVANSVLWDNQAPTGSELWLGRDCPFCLPSTVTIDYTNVNGSAKGVHVETGSTLSWGSGMLSAKPHLVDAASNDVHLRHDSPCRNAGDKSNPSLPDIDIDGDPRVLDALPDLGADEWMPRLYGPDHVFRGARLRQTLLGAPGGMAVWALSPRGLEPGLLIPGVGTLHLDPSAMVLLPAGAFPTSGVMPVAIEIPPALPLTFLLTQALAGTTLTNPTGLHILKPPAP